MQSSYDTNEMKESLGAHLKRAREEKNISIEQVAYATRISLKMLRALEEDDHTVLPAPTFVRGYLQAYAKYVRIDTQDLLLRYQHHLATAPESKRGALRSHYLYVRERYQEKRRLIFVIVLFAVMLSAAGAYFFLKTQREKHKKLAKTAEQIQKSDPSKSPPSAETALSKEPSKEAPKVAEKSPEKPQEKAEPKPPEAVTQPAPDKKPEPAKAPEPAPPPPQAVAATVPQKQPAPETRQEEKKNYLLTLKATEDVWFRFQTDEEEVKDLTLRAGKSLSLRANKVIKLFSGNLGAIKASLNGSEIVNLPALKGGKSAILPESEAANYKLPLFPQFQVKRVAAPSNNASGNESKTEKPIENSSTNPSKP